MPGTEDTRALPRVPRRVVDAVVDMLMTDCGSTKPPEKSAELLALIVELHKQGRPFPTRHKLAEALNSSVWTIDAALSTRTQQGYITLVVETTEGNVRQRDSTVKHRYYVPSKKLREIVEGARQRA